MIEPASTTVPRRRYAYTWLAAGAVTFGLGVALVDGVAVASADTGSAASSTSSAGPAQKHSASSARKAQGKPSPRVTASGSKTAMSTPVTMPSVRAAKAPTAAATPLQSLVRQLQYIFFNKAPTVVVNPNVRNQDGTVTGTLTGQSNNGFALTYSLGRKPLYGSVDVDAATGSYTYTPGGTAPPAELVDGFSIVANNGTAARLPGLLGAAQSVLHALAVGLGVSSKNTDESDVVVRLTGQSVVGTPEAEVDYWLSGNRNTAVLTVVGMVVGQLTGNMPTLAELTTQAMNTPSVAKYETVKQNGQSTNVPMKMYTGGKDSVVWAVDGNQLLAMRNLEVTGTYYSKSGGLQAAVDNLLDALEDGKSVIVNRTSPVAYTGYSGVYNSAHVVTVLGVDIDGQVVYINDGATPNGGQNLKMSWDDFVANWGPIYDTVVVSVPVE